MTRTLVLGALAAIAIGFAAPAQASMANPGLGAAASGNVEQAQYYYGSRRGYYGNNFYGGSGYYGRRSYAYAPRCFTRRIVTFDGRVRFVRRCR